MIPDLSVEIGPLMLKNPVLTASGTFGYGEEYLPYVDLNKLGGIITKGLSLEPRNGNPGPRIVETTAGMLNAVGLQNMGIRAFIREKLPLLRGIDTRIIVNVFGETVEEYIAVTRIINNTPGIHAIELNISCPNVKKGGISFGSDPHEAKAVTKAVRNETHLPLIVKLTPNVADITEIAQAAEDAGADAVSLINTITGMAVDIHTRRPMLANITGGLSGPAIKPIALRMVWQVATKVKIPVIGVGGIMGAKDALEFIITGATAVEVGTANFVNPSISGDIIEGMREFLIEEGIGKVTELRGSLIV